MKINSYIKNKGGLFIEALLFLLLGVFLLPACVKNDDLYAPNEATVYMPQAYQDKSVMTLYKMDDPQQVTFGAYYAGFNGPSSDITVDFALDPAQIDAYNVLNAYLGYSYYMFPDSVYSISGLTTTIKAGTQTSEPLSIDIQGKKIQFGYHYMLPIKITSISGGTKDSSLSVALFKMDSLLTRVHDLTSDGTLTVFRENSNQNENSPKLVDGSIDTKYLCQYSNDIWVQLEFPEPKFIDAYDMSSANDANTRDAKDWQLVGSNDGSTWVVLDDRKDEFFADRKITRRFNIASPGEYKFYRMLITANNGSSLYQQAEWRLLQFY
ncbi:hypothetical protein GCM10027051_26990 [Niabella terrae]